MSAVENSEYTGHYLGVDAKGRYRTWPAFAGPEPEDILPGWALPIPDELPRLVEPAPLQDPMVEVGTDG